MSGWHRIGVVLSVLWFVGFGGWLWMSEVNGHQDFYGHQIETCIFVAKMNREPLAPNDPQYAQKDAKIDGEERACVDRAADFLSQQMSSLRSGVWLIAAAAVASLILWWLLAGIIVSVGRWVAAGFRRAPR
jgi:hypothetical protein